MKEKVWDITEMEDLTRVVEEVVANANKDKPTATVLALHGDLGAGKTTFTQILARTLGVTEVVTSPTFVIMKIYNTNDDRFKTLVHIDAYRLENVDELRVLGFDEILKQKDTIICIEWAERIIELLPSHAIHLQFGMEGEKRTMATNSEF